MCAKKYSDEMVHKWAKEYEGGATFTDIAKRYGASTTTVKCRLEGVVEFRENSKYKKYADAWYRLYNSGYSLGEIATMYHVKGSAVRYILIMVKGVSMGDGEKRKYMELLPVFKKMYKEGYSTLDIEKKTGVPNKTVANYLREFKVGVRTHKETNREFPIQDDYFSGKITKRKAYILGLLFSVGRLSTGRKESVVEVYGSGGRIPVVDKVMQELTGGNYELRKVSGKTSMGCAFTSKRIYETLQMLGLVAGTFPELGVHFPYFMRGFLEGVTTISIKDGKPIAQIKVRHFNKESVIQGIEKEVKIGSETVRGSERSRTLYVYKQVEIQNLKNFIVGKGCC